MYAPSTPLLQCAFVSKASSTLPAVLMTTMIRLKRSRPERHHACHPHQQRCNCMHAGPWRSRLSLRETLLQPRHYSSSRPLATLATASDTSPPLATYTSKRYAVIGGGFAGIAVAWHLLASSTAMQPVSVDLYDAAGAPTSCQNVCHPVKDAESSSPSPLPLAASEGGKHRGDPPSQRVKSLPHNHCERDVLSLTTYQQ